jgi:hypothetical protein
LLNYLCFVDDVGIGGRADCLTGYRLAQTRQHARTLSNAGLLWLKALEAKARIEDVRKIIEVDLSDVWVVTFAEVMPELSLKPVARAVPVAGALSAG